MEKELLQVQSAMTVLTNEHKELSRDHTMLKALHDDQITHLSKIIRTLQTDVRYSVKNNTKIISL